jgi:hypothetical protein
MFNLFWRLLLAIEMIFWHNLQIEITTETEDTLRTDSTFCGDMAIWEQEKDIVVLDEYFLSYALFEGPSTVYHEIWVFAC